VQKNWVVSYLNHESELEFDWRGFRALEDSTINAILDLKPDIDATESATVEDAIYR
jgi:hypothetical protein